MKIPGRSVGHGLGSQKQDMQNTANGFRLMTALADELVAQTFQDMADIGRDPRTQEVLQHVVPCLDTARESARQLTKSTRLARRHDVLLGLLKSQITVVGFTHTFVLIGPQNYHNLPEDFRRKMEAARAENDDSDEESMPVKGFHPKLVARHQARWQKWAREDADLPCVEPVIPTLQYAYAHDSILSVEFAGLAMLLHKSLPVLEELDRQLEPGKLTDPTYISLIAMTHIFQAALDNAVSSRKGGAKFESIQEVRTMHAAHVEAAMTMAPLLGLLDMIVHDPD